MTIYAGISILRQNSQYLPRFGTPPTSFSSQIKSYAKELDIEVVTLSSNSESQIIDALCEAQERSAVDACVINPGGEKEIKRETERDEINN